MLVSRFGSTCGKSGTMARNRIAAERTSGQSSNILDAMLAPLE